MLYINSYNPLCISLNGKKAIEQWCWSSKPILFPSTTSHLVSLLSYFLHLHTGGVLDTRGHLNVIYSYQNFLIQLLSSTYGESAQNKMNVIPCTELCIELSSTYKARISCIVLCEMDPQSLKTFRQLIDSIMLLYFVIWVLQFTPNYPISSTLITLILLFIVIMCCEKFVEK